MPERFSRSGFERAAKRHQGYFRDESPTISDDGKRLTDDKGLRNSHLLAVGREQENLFRGIQGPDGAIGFFDQRNIKWWKSSRSGDDFETEGPTRNMASSQVACVNFLLPLAGIPGALAAALRTLDGDVQAVADIHHEGRTSPVEFEWLGIPRSLEGGRTRGSQNTSVDGFVIVETTAGRRRAYLLEWKYVEHYLSNRPSFKGEGTQGETRRRRYTEPFYAPYSSFDPVAAPELEDFFYEPFYQIMRHRLLADRMVQQRELDVDEAKVVVVVPEDNRAYRRVAHGKAATSSRLAERFPGQDMVHDVMRSCLKNPDAQFDLVAPYQLLEGVVRSLPDESVESANYWRERYGV